MCTQAICEFEIPGKSNVASDIEAWFVYQKFPTNLDWGYYAGVPTLYSKTPLNDLEAIKSEYLLRSKGVQTWAGYLLEHFPT